MRPWLGVVVLAAGCGRVGFDSTDAGHGQYLEAESMLVTPQMEIRQDPTASGGAFVLDSNPEGLPGPGIIQLGFSVPAATSYRIWCRARAVNLATDSFFISVDGEPATNLCTGFDGHSVEWQWVPVNLDDALTCPEATPRVLALGQGAHTLVFESREGLSAIDRILVTADLAYVPSD